MARPLPDRDEELPWQHEIFFGLSRMLNCKIHIGSIDGVIVLRDLAGGRNIIEHRQSIIRYLSRLYDGLEGVRLLVKEDRGWSLLDSNEKYELPPVFPLTEKTFAGALATVNYLNAGGRVPSGWAH